MEKIWVEDSIRIRILTPDSIPDSIRAQTADSQVPSWLGLEHCCVCINQSYFPDENENQNYDNLCNENDIK